MQIVNLTITNDQLLQKTFEIAKGDIFNLQLDRKTGRYGASSVVSDEQIAQLKAIGVEVVIERDTETVNAALKEVSKENRYRERLEKLRRDKGVG